MKKVVIISIILLFVASIIFMAIFGMDIVFQGERNQPQSISFDDLHTAIGADGITREIEVETDANGRRFIWIRHGDLLKLNWTIVPERDDIEFTETDVEFIPAHEIGIYFSPEGYIEILENAPFAILLQIRTAHNTRATDTLFLRIDMSIFV